MHLTRSSATTAPATRRRASLGASAAAAALLASAGCGGSSTGGGSGGGTPAPPVITVLVSNADCAIKDVKVSFTVEQYNSGGANILRIKANARCNDTPLNGVRLTFTIPGATQPTTADTDENGDASAGPLTPGNADLIGQDVGVSVTGADGRAYPQGSTTVTKAP